MTTRRDCETNLRIIIYDLFFELFDHSLLKIDAKVNLRAASSDIVASLPSRNLNEISEDFRTQLFTYTSSDVAVNLVTEGAVLKQVKS